LTVTRACACVSLSRSAYYKKPLDWRIRDAAVIAAIRKQVDKQSAWGFWQCYKQIRREGHGWNHKRVYRVYKLMKLHRRSKAKRRLPKREKAELYVPLAPDTVWSADFMSDALLCGKRFRLFNVVDDFNRELMHVEVDTSITSQRLIRIFEQLEREHGLPQILRTDNGPEFLGEAFIEWAKLHGMVLMYIQPGKPNQNAFVERFNRTMRDELLDQNLFLRLKDVREAVYWWQLEYNEDRCHDSLDDMTPMECRQKHLENSTFDLSP
jgi:putative transposase